MIGNYKEHAEVWEWDGYVESEELQYWCNWAKKYGKMF
jgi:hypothetical protein